MDDASNQKKVRWEQLLNSSRQETEAVLKGVDPFRVVYPAAGWRVKDIIAHLTVWEVEVVTSLRAYREGRRYIIFNFPGDDVFNQRAYEKSKDYAVEQIYGDWAAVRAAFLSLLRSLPPDKVDGEMMAPWGKMTTVDRLVQDMVDHEVEHRNDILKLLP
jgi:hypothetical protein